MDRVKCQQLRESMNGLFADLEKKHGVKVKIGRANYSSANAMFALEICDIVNGEAMTKEAEAYKRYAALYGLPEDGLGKTFQYQGKAYKIVGLSPKAYRFPVLVEANGKTYKFPVDTVQLKMGLPVKPLFSSPLEG